LQYSAAHRVAAEPQLRRLGLIKGPSAAESVDLLGESSPAPSSTSGGGQMDLLDMGGSSMPSSTSHDLLAF